MPKFLLQLKSLQYSKELRATLDTKEATDRMEGLGEKDGLATEYDPMRV
jgi:hypothetical protein